MDENKNINQEDVEMFAESPSILGKRSRLNGGDSGDTSDEEEEVGYTCPECGESFLLRADSLLSSEEVQEYQHLGAVARGWPGFTGVKPQLCRQSATDGLMPRDPNPTV